MANAYNVSPRMIQNAEYVKNNGIPEWHNVVMAGNATIGALLEIVEMPHDMQRMVLDKAMESGEPKKYLTQFAGKIKNNLDRDDKAIVEFCRVYVERFTAGIQTITDAKVRSEFGINLHQFQLKQGDEVLQSWDCPREMLSELTEIDLPNNQDQ